MSDSHGSPNFRSTVHAIPTPSVDNKGPKRFEPLVLQAWAVLLVCGIMISLAVGIEVGTYLSNKNDGFHVNKKNVFEFANLSPQFLSSFFPTLLVAPLAFLWGLTLFWFKLLQPYVALSKGDAKAAESVNENYLTSNRFIGLYTAMKHRHWILCTAGLLSFATALFQPLAGSLFEIKPTARTSQITVTSTRSIGLAPDVDSLNAFVAAAGFAEAAVFHNLDDPPFIRGGWATAEFKYPSAGSATVVSVSVNTTGVQTSLVCATSGVALSTPSNGNFTIVATAPTSFGEKTCGASVAFSPASANQQYGVVNVEGCTAETDVRFQPVMFWFFRGATSGASAQARAVFCEPAIAVKNVDAAASLTNGTLLNVTDLGTYAKENNVTGGALSGRAFNGLIFGPPSDDFVRARAIATASGVSGAIFRFAAQQPGGADAVFSDDDGFLALTRQVYTQHLSISAKSIYFVGVDEQLPAILSSMVPRLWIDPVPAHVLSAVLGLTGLLGLFLHLAHRRARSTLRLTHSPGSLASSAALTARSGFGELLAPYDTNDTLKDKLAHLRFRLDPRTGAVIADAINGREGVYGKRISSVGAKDVGSAPGTPWVGISGEERREEEVRISLLPLGQRHARTSSTSLKSGEAEGGIPRPLPGNGGAGGYLDAPYAWEPYKTPWEGR